METSVKAPCVFCHPTPPWQSWNLQTSNFNKKTRQRSIFNLKIPRTNQNPTRKISSDSKSSSFGSHHLSCWKTLISRNPSLSLSRSEKHRLPSKPAIENCPITGLGPDSIDDTVPPEMSVFVCQGKRRGSTGIGMRTSKQCQGQCPLYWPSWLHEKYPIVEQCQCHRWGEFDSYYLFHVDLQFQDLTWECTILSCRTLNDLCLIILFPATWSSVSLDLRRHIKNWQIENMTPCWMRCRIFEPSRVCWNPRHLPWFPVDLGIPAVLPCCLTNELELLSNMVLLGRMKPV